MRRFGNYGDKPGFSDYLMSRKNAMYFLNADSSKKIKQEATNVQPESPGRKSSKYEIKKKFGFVMEDAGDMLFDFEGVEDWVSTGNPASMPDTYEDDSEDGIYSKENIDSEESPQPDRGVSPGEILRELIKKAGMTQNEFYTALGITKPYFYDIISGRTNPPPYPLQLKMMDLLDADVAKRSRFFDSAAKLRGELPADIVQFLLENPDVFEYLRNDIRNFMKEGI